MTLEQESATDEALLHCLVAPLTAMPQYEERGHVHSVSHVHSIRNSMVTMFSEQHRPDEVSVSYKEASEQHWDL